MSKFKKARHKTEPAAPQVGGVEILEQPSIQELEKEGGKLLEIAADGRVRLISLRRFTCSQASPEQVTAGGEFSTSSIAVAADLVRRRLAIPAAVAARKTKVESPKEIK